jgi:hypothetical protein
MTNALAIFEGYRIRRHFDEKTETWFFFGGGYFTGFNPATGLSGRQKLLESLEKQA